MLDRLQQALVHGNRSGHATAVLYLDLDDFKAVNDGLGHHAGDDLLQAVAGRLLQQVRSSDTVGRLGGDEFAIVLVDVTATMVQSMAEAIRQCLTAPYILGGHQVQARTSIGIALSTATATDPEALLQAADLALYAAKAQGKDRVWWRRRRDPRWAGDQHQPEKQRAAMPRHSRRSRYRCGWDSMTPALWQRARADRSATLRWARRSLPKRSLPKRSLPHDGE